MKPKIVFMFAGQGSQYFGMGRELYAGDPVFRHHMDRLDARAVALTGRSVLAHLYGAHDSAEAFDDLALSHPAIVMVECALAQTLIAAGIQPDLTLGCSLGSFAAAAVSGLIDTDDALMLAIRQADAVSAGSEPGAMIAIMADASVRHADVLQRHAVIAAENFASHFIVTTPQGYVETIEAYLRAANLNAQRLAVRYPFHSRWLDGARQRFIDDVTPLPRRLATVPMWCCAGTGPVDRLPDDYFWTVVRQPIRFSRTIQCLEERGPWQYLDLSPSGTLSTFLKYLLPGGSRSSFMAAMTRFGRELQSLAAVRAACCQ